MSVVVALKDGDRILMGCDSQITSNYNKMIINKVRKIWKPNDNNNILMGFVGSLRDHNILSIVEEWVDEATILKDEVNFKYIVKNVVPKIFKELSQYDRVIDKEGIKYLTSQIMFAYKDKCFSIYDDGCVIELEDILVLGSGTDLSLGAFNAIKNEDISTKAKMIKIIKSACDNDLYVNYPIVIMNTMDDDIDIIEK